LKISKDSRGGAEARGTRREEEEIFFTTNHTNEDERGGEFFTTNTNGGRKIAKTLARVLTATRKFEEGIFAV